MFSINLLKTRSNIMCKAVCKVQFRNRHNGVDYFFKKNLLVTNSISSGAFLAIGDLIQQEYQSRVSSKKYDLARTARMFAVGTLVGPLHHYYYLYLDKLIPIVNLKTVLAKIFLDQFFCSPATLVFFFYGMGTLEGKSFDKSTEELGNKFTYTYLGDWLYWPPVQFVNFYYLSTQYRVFYINVATMIFNIFLSFMKHEV